MLSTHYFGSTSNPLVEAARKAILGKDECAVSSDGVLGETAQIEAVQNAVDKNAKVSKLEEHPFGSI